MIHRKRGKTVGKGILDDQQFSLLPLLLCRAGISHLRQSVVSVQVNGIFIFPLQGLVGIHGGRLRRAVVEYLIGRLRLWKIQVDGIRFVGQIHFGGDGPQKLLAYHLNGKCVLLPGRYSHRLRPRPVTVISAKGSPVMVRPIINVLLSVGRQHLLHRHQQALAVLPHHLCQPLRHKTLLIGSRQKGQFVFQNLGCGGNQHDPHPVFPQPLLRLLRKGGHPAKILVQLLSLDLLRVKFLNHPSQSKRH